MKIALACPASLPATQFGGILFLCVDIAKELSDKGHQMKIFTTDLDFANNAKTFNKKLPRVEKIKNFEISRSHVWFALELFFVNPGMYFQMIKENPDIIHTIGVRSFQSLIAALVAKKKKIPLVISDQGGLTTHPDLFSGGIIKKLLYKIQEPMIRFVINQATKISVANDYEKRIFAKFCDDSKIAIVRNGINLASLQIGNIDFKEKYNIKQDYILFVGRFSKVKGVDILLNAFNAIKEKSEVDNIKLVIMGVDFGFESEMYEMIKKLGISNKTTVIKNPPRQDVIAAYRQCRFLVLPSRWELSPLTPLEGFAFKKTVISTKSHGIPFTITDKIDCLLTEPEDHNMLADAILTLLRDRMLCDNLGLAGYNKVQEAFNSQIMAEETLKIYQQIINR
jgi:glycosyltransferase involved in cell wall biosynthesis